MSQLLTAHPSFERVRSQRVPSLNIEVAEYRHRGTGARHFHLAAEDRNNAFLVAFLTVPQDSTGVAHILEHTSLCGSERFPVRDPFFMMTRRSLNTFMNAFTSSDWTAYPFASQNHKDFGNLLEVYLDAVFFPRLDELDFAQEGHRVEFEIPDDPATDLVYKGVVYNEMKGAMSSPVQTLWQVVHGHLFPSITYHYNSGGEPEHIPELSYAQLKAFHAHHYHPSNAVFMTYGDHPVAEHQARLHELALRRFQAQPMALDVPDERRYASPVQFEARYALDGEHDTRDKTHVVLAWLLGKVSDPREVMNAHLLNGVLQDHSASPLRRALETCSLGSAPSELCGLDDSTREMGFFAGLEGSNPEQAEAIERLILDVLGDVAVNGVPLAQMESVLHQIELSQREIRGGGFPYGLRLMVNSLTPTIHGADPVQALEIDPVLEALRRDIQDPDFIKGLTRTLLLENPHRVRVVMVPDTELSATKAAREKARLAALKAAMTEANKRRVVERAAALQARQQTPDDPEGLPKVGLEDIPSELKIVADQPGTLAGMPVAWYAQGTNGMVYQQIVVDLPALDEGLLDLLPLFCACVTEVGCAGRDYLEAQTWQAEVSGGIGARCSVRSGVDDGQTQGGAFVLYGKALARNQEGLSELLRTTFELPRFDELLRLRELISQIRAHVESSITDRGHSLAMIAACAGMSATAQLSQRWNGLAGIEDLKALDDALEDPPRLEDFAAGLEQIRAALRDRPRQLLVVSEAERKGPIEAALRHHWEGLGMAITQAPNFALAPVQERVNEAWTLGTQVNFCAKAYPAVPANHPDAPVLTVLGGFLRNGYLHTVIREQGGAYGAGAGYDSDASAFRFYSYRDPRLTETLTDFDRSLEWLQTHRHEYRELEEAILGVIAQIDRPDSPAGEAISAFFGSLHGRTPEQRRRFRDRVLRVTRDDLKRVGETYLQPDRASVAVLSDAKTVEGHGDLGLTVHAV